jgi:hypothetical protein
MPMLQSGNNKKERKRENLLANRITDTTLYGIRSCPRMLLSIYYKAINILKVIALNFGVYLFVLFYIDLYYENINKI